MAATRSDVIGWLAGRLEWEQTLARLHARAHYVEAPQGLPTGKAAGKLRSPVRGMSCRSLLLRIRP